MPDPLVKILSTKAIPEAVIQKAREKNILIESIPFIEIKHRAEAGLAETLNAYSKKKIIAVFTSENAVNAVLPALKTKPAWKIFCISGKTKKSLLRHFDEEMIIGSATNGTALSQLIIDYKPVKNCIFFCGNKRMSTLPESLSLHHIPLTELVVYDTYFSPKKIKENYDGILFFSPSAVESFFSNNTIDPNTVLFSIGKTTEKAIGKFTGNTIITSAFPGTDEMIKQVIDHKWKPTVKRH